MESFRTSRVTVLLSTMSVQACKLQSLKARLTRGRISLSTMQNIAAQHVGLGIVQTALHIEASI
jgi:hypothetical protein